MPSSTTQWVKTAISVAGAATAGPVGAILGRLAGSMLEASLPGMAGFLSGVTGNQAGGGGSLTGGALQAMSGKITGSLTSLEKLHINHDLQAGFMDACCEALYDIGGKECFPAVWADRPREVPGAILFPGTPEGHMLWHSASPLAAQAAECLQKLERAVREQLIIPLDPPSSEPAASAEVYLQAQTPAELNQGFFEHMIWPFFAQYQSLHAELPALSQHLQRHLLDRSLVHLGKILKTRTPAWRTFNRAVLEGLRLQVRELSGGQAEILQQFEALAPSGCSVEMADRLADLLATYGQMEKESSRGLDALGQQAADIHLAEMQRLELLAATSPRMETRVERVLRFKEDGKWVIDGPAPAAAGQAPEPGEPPFKGMQYFEEADAVLFFGREQLAARLASLLDERPMLVVTGASGSGKSSLVRAGLIPALRRGKGSGTGGLSLSGATRWPVLLFTPTAHPLEALAACLTRSSESMREALMLLDELKADPRSLEIFARRLAGPADSNRKVVLVVDQFEELFTLCHDPDERQAFIDMLVGTAGASGADSPLRVVITLRADFYAACAHYPGLREVLSKWQEFIGPMEPQEVRRAIEEPARRGGWSFEPGLVDLILRDIGAEGTHPPEPGALPLLSHALLETWKRRRRRMMTLESYAETGGVRKAIAHTAETVYHNRLNAHQQAAARRIFIRLTDLGEGSQPTRRRARLDDFSSSSADEQTIAMVLHVLAEARLVTTSEDSVEVAHEALIREWPTLQRWLEQDRESIRIQRRLSEAADEWQRGSQDTGLLYRGARLAEAGEWAADNPGELNTLETRFLTVSQEMQQSELNQARQRAAEMARLAGRMRRRSFYLAAALLIVAILAAFSVLSWRRAESSAAQAILQQQTAESARAEAEQQKDAAEQQRDAAVQQKDAAEQARQHAQEQQQIAERTFQGAMAQAIQDEIEYGWWLYQDEQYPEAKDKFDAAILQADAWATLQDAPVVEAYLGRAWVAYKLEDYPAAVKDFAKVRQGKPELLDESAWDALGWAYFWTEDFDQALVSFSKAVELDPQLVEAYSGQGWASYRMEDYPAAILSFEQGLALDPDNVNLYDGLGHIYYQLGDYAKAVENIEQAIALDEDYAYYVNLAYLGWSNLQLNRLDQALAYFEQARQIDPENFDPYRGLGDLYYQRGNMELALENYQKYLDLIQLDLDPVQGQESPEDYVLRRVEDLTQK